MNDVGGMKLKLVEYDSLTEFAQVRKTQRSQTKEHDATPSWAGGSVKDLYSGCERGDPAFADKADELISHFSNSAIEDYEMALEWNDQNGELDYEAAMGGEELFMYGPTIEKTPTAPVNLYVDQWTSCTIPTEEMMRRGIAILALAQALSIYRPVNTYVATGTRHMPTKTNLVQVIKVPTNPMDTSRASWMLASPSFFRQGQLPLTFYHSRSNRSCGVPCLNNRDWQTTQLGKWLAEREGIEDCIHLPLMFHSESMWKSNETTLEWVKDNMKRMLPEITT